MRKMWKLFNLIFPSRCPSCNRSTDSLKHAPFCTDCWQSLTHNPDIKRCRTCGIALPSDYSFKCITCIRERPHYKKVYVFGDYDGALKTAINLLKFEKVRRLSIPLGELLASLSLPPVDVFLPVPLSKERLILRGFNQSHLLCHILSMEFSIPMEPNILVKPGDIQPQSLLSRAKRLKNPKGAFSVIMSDRKLLPGRVFIVDDVMTTGATINECARVLLSAGVKEVYGAVLARTKSE